VKLCAILLLVAGAVQAAKLPTREARLALTCVGPERPEERACLAGVAGEPEPATASQSLALHVAWLRGRAIHTVENDLTGGRFVVGVGIAFSVLSGLAALAAIGGGIASAYSNEGCFGCIIAAIAGGVSGIAGLLALPLLIGGTSLVLARERDLAELLGIGGPPPQPSLRSASFSFRF
jgi:hypothetical protein